MKKIYSWFFRKCPPCLLLLLVTGCTYNPDLRTSEVGEVEGYVPVYGTVEDTEIRLVASQPVQNPGKIYTYGKFLLINEQRKGIHVFDNTEPANPEPIGFIKMLGNTDMAIRNDVLYANHLGNLVALTVRDFSTLEKAGSLSLGNWDKGLAAPRGHYFECLDLSRGVVVGWKKQTLLNPSCYAF